MDERKNKILNYFILLQILKFNREKTTEIFLKYKDIYALPFVETLFYIEEQDKVLYFSYNDEYFKKALSVFDEKINGNLVFIEDAEYPYKMLSNNKSPIVFFYSGILSLINKYTISVVGTRNPTEQGEINAKRLAKYLVSRNIVITSGLARGIDTIAHKVAKEYDYSNVIGVIGTSLAEYYPKENKHLQEYVSTKGLLVSEFANFENIMKWNFLRRNFFMSLINDISIVVEAGDTSGTVNQARNTIKNNKPLYIPANVFDNPKNSWPSKFRMEYNKIYKFGNFNELNDLLEEHLFNK